MKVDTIANTIQQLAEEKKYQVDLLADPRHKEYNLLLTNGLRKINQQVDKGSEAYEQIELFFCLPEYWDLKQKSWPLEWLKKLSDFVVSEQSWLGNGHTILLKETESLLEPNFQAAAFFLMKPVYLKQFYGDDFVSENGFVPLAVIPIFKAELDLKLRTSHNLLLERLDAKGYDERVDIFRESATRKKIFGIF